MREIKFRAWDKEHKCWFENELLWYGFHIFGECTMCCMPRVSCIGNIEITQYTGLKDKNGKEIYEGDILKDHINCIYSIEFQAGSWMAIDHTTIADEYLYSKFEKRIEVIGNIYENPELLEQK